MTNKISHTFLLALLCATQISTNVFGMDPTSLYELRRTGNERLELLPEIQGKIVTTILDLYLNELEKTIQKFDEYSYGYSLKIGRPIDIFHNCGFSYKKHDTHSSLYKILNWIHRTCFKPLQEHINLNTKSSHGNTILHHTTRASIECTDSGNLYPFHQDHFMQCHGNIDMFNLTRYLLEHKINPNTHNNLGQSPFVMWTKLFFHGSYSVPRRPVESELIHLFLDNKADPNVASKDHSFIFTLATGSYFPAIERILKNTDLQAIMNRRGEYGDTLAIQAIHWSNLEFLQILADAGADFDITDSKGRTPLDVALEYQDFITAKHGAEHFEKMITLLKSKTTNK